MVELISEVDKNDNFLRLRDREEFYSGEHIHRAAQLILLNPENKMLIQKRSSKKRWYPNRYTYSVSGTVADESYEACMMREMLEEIGISIPKTKEPSTRYFQVDVLQKLQTQFGQIRKKPFLLNG